MRRLLPAVVLVLLAVTSRVPAQQNAAVTFADAATAAGITFHHQNGASREKYLAETMGSGAVLFDYDNDGAVDIFFVDGGSMVDRAAAAKARHRLYHNRGNGTFEDRTAASGITHAAYGMGACAADVDNDGHVDLYVTGVGSNALYRNTGGGAFVDATRRAGVAAGGWSTSCAFADFDRDGDADLFVTRYVDAPMDRSPFCGDARADVRVYCHPLNFRGMTSLLFRNDGHGVFSDVTAASGVAGVRGNGLGVVVGDYDDDQWPDVFVANDAVPNFLFHNEHDGTFTEASLAAGVSVARDGKPRAGMGTDFGDLDGDGRLDLVVTNHEFETHSLFHNEGGGLFTDATIASGIGPPTLPYVGFGTALFDYDNDTRLDLAIVNGHVIDNTAQFRAGSSHAQKNLLFHNTGAPRLVEVSRQSGPGFALEKVSRTLAVADLDNDGDLDLVITNNGQTPDLLRNDGGSSGRALMIRLVGVQSNRDGIGARLQITAGGRRQIREVKAGSSYLGQNDTRVHVGLGTAARADRIDIQWPSGKRDSLTGVAAGQTIVVQEGRGIVRRVPFHP
jgi:hypothetical protein